METNNELLQATISFVECEHDNIIIHDQHKSLKNIKFLFNTCNDQCEISDNLSDEEYIATVLFKLKQLKYLVYKNPLFALPAVLQMHVIVQAHGNKLSQIIRNLDIQNICIYINTNE